MGDEKGSIIKLLKEQQRIKCSQCSIVVSTVNDVRRLCSSKQSNVSSCSIEFMKKSVEKDNENLKNHWSFKAYDHRLYLPTERPTDALRAFGLLLQKIIIIIDVV